MNKVFYAIGMIIFFLPMLLGLMLLIPFLVFKECYDSEVSP